MTDNVVVIDGSLLEGVCIAMLCNISLNKRLSDVTLLYNGDDSRHKM